MKAVTYKIEGPWLGRLMIVPRPRGGDWLEDEVKAWKDAGIDVLVSALTVGEMADFDLTSEAELCVANAVEYASIAIEDRSVPDSAEFVRKLVETLEQRLASGKNGAIHCRQSIGRSSLLAACTLVGSGISVTEAFARIKEARGCPVPETAEQRAWVERFAKTLIMARVQTDRVER